MDNQADFYEGEVKVARAKCPGSSVFWIFLFDEFFRSFNLIPLIRPFLGLLKVGLPAFPILIVLITPVIITAATPTSKATVAAASSAIAAAAATALFFSLLKLLFSQFSSLFPMSC